MAAKKSGGKKKPDDAARASSAPPGTTGSYDDWTVDELRRRARELGLSGYSGKKKSALIALLRSH